MDTNPQSQFSAPLSQIVADPKLQPRVDGIDPDHVRDLAQVAEHWPPITVVRRGIQYHLVDGFHRFAAAQQLGLAVIPAVAVVATEGDDLLALGFSLNAAHGRPLSSRDRQAEAVRQLKAHPEASNREIARRCGLAQGTVAKLRTELESGAQIPELDARVGRDGRTYTHARRGSTKRVSLLTVLGNIADAFNPSEHRAIARYLQKLVEVLEEQDKLKGFKTFDDAADACRTTLGEAAAKDLGERIGWSSNNIFKIALALGYKPEDE